MATSFEKLSFTKDWNNASDFPSYKEFKTAGTYTVDLPADTVAVYALAVGAGGGGGRGCETRCGTL